MIKTDSSLYKSLIFIGLSGKEASVYLSLLELGKRTVTPIARNANINRTTVYDILDSLIAKGLVSVSGKEPLQEYLAESPDKITTFVKEDIEKKQRQLKLVEDLVPELKSIHNVSDRPKVRFYEGKEGLEQVYEDTLTSHEPIISYATFDDMHKALPDYFPKYYKRRAKKGIFIRGIVPKTSLALERKARNKEEAREIAFVPAEEYYFSPEIDIYDNKVMIASWREKLGIIIESKEISDAMKKIFKLAWAEAKRLDKKI